jgi:regulation of enolase protein 1 (concanavalin A-like superfamily)
MVNHDEFNWINKSEIKIENDKVFIKSTNRSDFFCNPVDGVSISNAPFYYREIERDFLISARVKPAFKSTYDACTIFVYSDEKHWLKTAFENTDFGTHAIVTVATNNYSDDANSVNIKEDDVYLQIIRKGDVFACHYSTNGKDFYMARLLRLALPATVKVGISAQSPTGEGQIMEFSNLKITKTLPKDIRKSI